VTGSLFAAAHLTAAPTSGCLPGFSWACKLPGTIASDAWGAVVGSFTKSVGTTLALLFTFWEKIPSPSLSSAAGSPVGDLQGVLWWVVGPIAVLGVLVGVGRMAWSQRAQPGIDTVKSVALLSVVMGGGVAVVAGLVTAADALAGAILSRASGGDFQTRLSVIGRIDLAANTQLGGADSALVLLIALVAILGSLVQCGVLLLRGALLVVMVATLPLAASATNTETGRAWFRKSTAWLIAFILIKPGAALVYATAFYLIGDGADAASEVGGMVLLALSALTLPALMRLLVPAVASVASGGGAGEAIAGLGAVATGALGGGGSGSGSGGGVPAFAGAAGAGGGGGSKAGLAAHQSSPLAAAALSSRGVGAGAAAGAGVAGATGQAGAPAGDGSSGSSGGGSGGGFGGAGLAGASGAAGAAGAAGTAAAAAGGPAGLAARAGLNAAGEAAKGAKALGDAATGTGIGDGDGEKG